MHFTEPEDKTPFLQPKDITKLQQVIGEMLYYARVLDGTLMTPLYELVSAQTNGTQATICATEKLMDCCHTHSDETILYCSSQMQLHIHSDASYLSVSKARIRVGGHFFLSDHFDPNSPTKHNVAVLVVASILKNSWRLQQKYN